MGMEAGYFTRSKKRKASAPTPTAEDLPGAGEGGGGAGADRISDLPDGVLGDIISLLPTREGARTQVLASRWRHLWRSAPLNLDHHGICEHEGDLDAVVLLVLAAHPGPGRRFCAPVYHLDGAIADAWLRSPALNNLHELDLCSSDYSTPRPPARPQPPPAAAFRFSDTLCVATIGECHIPDSTVQTLHFPKLKKLGLRKASISESSLHTMIDGCPVLECLLIYRSYGFRCVRINSISLRSIGVGGFSSGYWRETRFEELVIESAPCLETLLQLKSFANPPISVISAPKLMTLGYLCSYGTRLAFDSTVIEGLCIASLTTMVCSVKILAIDMDALSLDTVVDLMICFPCLEKLYIQSTGPGKTNIWRRKQRYLLRYHEIQLKTIVWRYYRGIKAHVDFATFFVLNAGLLESMTFEVHQGDYNEAFFAQQRKMLQVDNRASRRA